MKVRPPRPGSHRSRTAPPRARTPLPRTRLSPLRALARAASWHRRPLAALATAVAVLLGLAAVAPAPEPSERVVRAARALRGGSVVTTGDVTVTEVPRSALPEGTLGDPHQVVGRILSGPRAPGEVLTDAAVLTSGTVGPGRAIAPVRVADTTLGSLLHVGDRVDVLAADGQSPRASLVAADVRVLAVPASESDSATGALVLLDVDRPTAAALAQAAASATVTVTWR